MTASVIGTSSSSGSTRLRIGARLYVPGRRLAWLLAVIAVVVLAVARNTALHPAAVPHPASQRGAVSDRRLAVLPVGAQAPVSAALGRDEPGYSVTGMRATNPAQRLDLAFSPAGVSVASGAGRVRIRLAGFGYASALEPVARAVPRAAANRVVYARRGGVREWYQNGPLGLEQGFDVAKRPRTGSGLLTLSLALTGDLRARLGGDGVSLTGHGAALRYGGLVVRDARGRTLRSWLQLQHGHLLIRIQDQAARYPLRIDPFLQQAELTASDGAAEDEFGFSVAVSGATIAVGAQNHGPGAVYVFSSSGGSWTQTAELTAADGAAGDGFGYSVAVSGSTIAVGAIYHQVGSKADQGAVYAFSDSGSSWIQTAELTVSGGTADEWFGISVAVSGSTIAAGAATDDQNGNPEGPGAVYTFANTGSGWTQTAELTGADSVAGSEFGASVAMSGSTLAVGELDSKPGPGAVYVFSNSSGSWAQTAELTASDGTDADVFGYSVATSGSAIAAGAPYHQVGSNTDQGAVYVFTNAGGGWAQTAELTASDGAANDQLGTSVAMSGSTIAAGAPTHQVGSNTDQGAVYAFSNSGSGWAQSAELTASDGAANDQLGTSVAVSGGTIAVGAPYHQVGSSETQGAAYVFGAGLTVTSTSDLPNSNPSGTVCDDGSGVCTLRGAIQAANGLGGDQTIDFDIPGGGVPEISPASPLPAVTAQVTVDGGSQPGTATAQPGVELDGASAGAGANGLVLRGGDSTVEGLIVNDFAGAGIDLEAAGGDDVAGDWLGTRAGASGGYVDAPDGVGVLVDAPDATVGGTTADDRNVIANGGDAVGAIHSLAGVNRDDPPAAAALESTFLGFGAGVRIGPGGDDAHVLGNHLGLNPGGSLSGPTTPELGHTALTAGIQVAPQGGSVSGVTISGNVVTDAVAGIQVASVSGSASGVTIGSNLVGPNAAGTVDDLIGNAIGIEAQGDVSGLVIGGSTATANTVQGNALGVSLAEVSGANVSNNMIGTNGNISQLAAALSSPDPNPGLHNIIGVVLAGTGHTTLAKNSVLGDVMGVLSASTSSSRANQITGNTIGYTPANPPSTAKGLVIGGVGSLIGILDGNAPGDTISGNTIELTAIGELDGGGHGVTIQGNTVTTNAFGIVPVQEAASSVRGNTIVRNDVGLLFIHGELTPTELKDVGANNAPVTEADQTAAVTSPGSEPGLAMVSPEGGSGLTSTGIVAETAGATPAASARTPHTVTPGFAANITGNLIGTNAQSQKLGNGLGAWLIGDVTGSFATNRVANNTDGGIWVGPSVEGHFPTATISKNSLYNDGADAKDDGVGIGLGIDLLGGDGSDINFNVTPNHAGGSVSGPDGLQNYPVLTGSLGGGGGANIVGILDSAANTNYRVELFASPACSPSGNGEGQQFLESVPVSTDGSGLDVFAATLHPPAGMGVITATATGPDGTSEFSHCLVLPGCSTASSDIARTPAVAATTAFEEKRRAAVGAARDKPTCSVSAQRRQKELQLKQQIMDLQVLRNDLNANKAGQWYVAQVFGGASAFPPTAVLTSPIAGIWGVGALVSEENAAQLETQIAGLQRELDSMIQADRQKPAPHLASVANASSHAARKAGKLGVIAVPHPIKLLLPRANHPGIRLLEAVLTTQARIRSLQDAANVTQQRALAATKARNAPAAKRQWLALARYDEQTASAWRSIGRLRGKFTKLLAAAARGRKLTAKAAAKALKKFTRSLPAFALNDARRLGDLAGLRGFARQVAAFDPKLLAGPLGKLLTVDNEVLEVPITPVVQALSTAAAIAKSLAAKHG